MMSENKYRYNIRRYEFFLYNTRNAGFLLLTTATSTLCSENSREYEYIILYLYRTVYPTDEEHFNFSNAPEEKWSKYRGKEAKFRGA
jgi:hypothetical protein